MTIRSFLKAACITIAFSSGSALAGHHEKGEMASQTIVEVAIGAEQVSTLVTAIKAAGLVETLSGEGPFTVFAPTNEAFANLPEGALEGLLADTDKLTAVLTAHVAGGKVKAAEVVTMTEVETLNGKLAIAVNDGTVTIGNATVVATDIMGSNGVIHLIDTVIIPD